MTMITFDPDENVLIKIHKHWFFIVAEVIVLVILFVLPVALVSFILSFDVVKFDGSAAALGSALAGMWFLVLWIAFFAFWTGFYLDIWVVTDKRIVDVDQKRLFHREVATMRLDRIQDIAVEVKGILASLMNIGTLRVQSAGETQEFIMEGISAPYQVKDAISQLANAAAERARTVRIEE